MSAETIVYDALSVVGVESIVGSNIYPGMLPQGKKLPAVVFVRTGTEHITTIHSAESLAQKATMEVLAVAESFKVAEELADAVEAAMVPVAAFPSDRRQEIDPDSGAFLTILTYQVWA